MNKKVILINTIFVIIVFFLIEGITYFTLSCNIGNVIQNYSLTLENSYNDIFKETIQPNMRETAGEQYKDSSKGILVMGCSYAFGHMLENRQTFSYKLSEKLKRTVYNKAFDFYWGINNAYGLLSDENFYKEVKNIDTIIYIYISDHKNRTKGIYFDDLMDGHHEFLRYKYKDGNFYKYSFWSKNPLLNFSIFKSFKKIMFVQSQNKIDDVFFCKTMLDKMRENAIKHYGENLKFIILNYASTEDNLIEELKKDSHYKVINVSDLVDKDIDLFSKKYQLQYNDEHPNETAWNTILPAFIQEMNK